MYPSQILIWNILDSSTMYFLVLRKNTQSQKHFAGHGYSNTRAPLLCTCAQEMGVAKAWACYPIYK